MTVTVKDLGGLVLYLGAVAAALTTIGVVLRYAVLRPLRRWVRDQVQGLHEPLDQVRREVSPNGGGASLRDAVARTETQGERLGAQVERLGERLGDHLINHPGPGG